MSETYLTPRQTLEQEVATLKREHAQFARWIVQRGMLMGDHACVQCHPFSEMVVAGFICAYHLALAAQPVKPAPTLMVMSPAQAKEYEAWEQQNRKREL